MRVTKSEETMAKLQKMLTDGTVEGDKAMSIQINGFVGIVDPVRNLIPLLCTHHRNILRKYERIAQ